jgi:hypothetical protein
VSRNMTPQVGTNSEWVDDGLASTTRSFLTISASKTMASRDQLSPLLTRRHYHLG